jgi:hypothetical protein
MNLTLFPRPFPIRVHSDKFAVKAGSLLADAAKMTSSTGRADSTKTSLKLYLRQHPLWSFCGGVLRDLCGHLNLALSLKGDRDRDGEEAGEEAVEGAGGFGLGLCAAVVVVCVVVVGGGGGGPSEGVCPWLCTPQCVPCEDAHLDGPCPLMLDWQTCVMQLKGCWMMHSNPGTWNLCWRVERGTGVCAASPVVPRAVCKRE